MTNLVSLARHSLKRFQLGTPLNEKGTKKAKANMEIVSFKFGSCVS